MSLPPNSVVIWLWLAVVNHSSFSKILVAIARELEAPNNLINVVGVDSVVSVEVEGRHVVLGWSLHGPLNRLFDVLSF